MTNPDSSLPTPLPLDHPLVVKHAHLIDQPFGRLTVEYVAQWVNKQGANVTVLVCRCACDNYTFMPPCNLLTGNTKSCGCIVYENKGRAPTHGMKRTSTYRTWVGMRQRCNNPDDRAYKNYGGRGITVCDRWNTSFENFYTDMGPRPPGMWLERVENNAGYSPENCIWTTPKEQLRNKRTTIRLTYHGMTHKLVEWAEILDVDPVFLRRRLKDGWSVEDTLEIVAITARKDLGHNGHCVDRATAPRRPVPGFELQLLR